MAERRLPDEIVIRQLVERALEAVEAGHRGAAPPGHRPRPPRRRHAGIPAQPTAKTVAIGADHGGFALKAVLIKHLGEKGFAVTDCGTNSPDAVDYPDFAHVVARLVSTGACAAGIVDRRRRHRLRDGRQQGPGRPRRQRARHLDGAQRPRAQLRQRADPRRADDRRGYGPRGHGHVPRDPLGRGTARQARREDHRGSSSSTERPRQRNRDDRPASRRPRPADRGDHPPGAGQPRRARGAAGTATGSCATCTGSCAARCAPKVARGRGRRRVARSATPARRVHAGGPRRSTSTTRCSSRTRPPRTSTSSATRPSSHRFASVCINPVWVARAAANLKGTGVPVASVIGFPFGATLPEIKAHEARTVIRGGRPRDRHGHQHRRAQVGA